MALFDKLLEKWFLAEGRDKARQDHALSQQTGVIVQPVGAEKRFGEVNRARHYRKMGTVQKSKLFLLDKAPRPKPTGTPTGPAKLPESVWHRTQKTEGRSKDQQDRGTSAVYHKLPMRTPYKAPAPEHIPKVRQTMRSEIGAEQHDPLQIPGLHALRLRYLKLAKPPKLP